MEEGLGKLDGFGSLLLEKNLHKYKETGDDGGSLEGRSGSSGIHPCSQRTYSSSWQTWEHRI